MLLSYFILMLCKWLMGVLVNWLLVFLTCLHHSLSTSLRSSTRCSGAILNFLNPSGRVNYFSKEPWFLLWRMALRNQYLGAKCAYSFWSVTASRPSQQTELGNVRVCVFLYTFTHTNIHTFIARFISISTYLYIKKHKFILATNWIVFLQSLYVEALSSNVTVFGLRK